jgi:hypothetical protein
MNAAMVRRLRRLAEENKNQTRLVAKVSRDTTMRQDAPGTSLWIRQFVAG